MDIASTPSPLSPRRLIKPAIRALLARDLAREPWKTFGAGTAPDPAALAATLASLLTQLDLPWVWWGDDEFPDRVSAAVANAVLSPLHRPWPMLDAASIALTAGPDWPVVLRRLASYRAAVPTEGSPTWH